MIIEVLKNNTYEETSDLPAQGTPQSSGYDVKTISDPEIVGEYNEEIKAYSKIQYIQYKTNLQICIKSEEKVTGINAKELVNYDVLAFPRSSIGKYNLILSNCIGLIDQDYRGEILIRFKYQFQPEDLIIVDGKIYGKVNYDAIYKKDDDMCQLKPSRREDCELILVNEFSEKHTVRGEGGFGHTTNLKKNSINEAKHVMSTIETLYNKISDTNKKPKGYIELIKERDRDL